MSDIISSTIDLGLGSAPARQAVIDRPAITVPSISSSVDSVIEQTLAERESSARAAATAAGGVLSRIIQHGQVRAAATIDRILNETPTDAIVGNKRLGWNLRMLPSGGHQVTVKVDGAFGGEPLMVHRHALGQVCDRFALPIKYLSRLVDGEQWERDLARGTLNTHTQNKAGKAMLRVYGGQVRGFLSDAYKRIDSRPMLDSLLTALNEVGFVVYSGEASDVRVSVRALKPQIYEVGGEPVVFGLSWENSDYGAGKHEVKIFLLRTVCLNGMTGESLMSNTHLGSRASDDIRLRESTRKAGEEYFTGLIHDAVTTKAGPAAIEKTMAAVKTATEERITLGDSLPVALRRGLSKPEQERVKAIFDSDECVMLPPAPTKARLANVLSWMANTASNPDRAMDLQAMAGTVMGI